MHHLPQWLLCVVYPPWLTYVLEHRDTAWLLVLAHDEYQHETLPEAMHIPSASVYLYLVVEYLTSSSMDRIPHSTHVVYRGMHTPSPTVVHR